MTRRYYFPAIAVSFISMILLVLITISTPTTLSDATPFDFVRSNNLNGTVDLSPGSNANRPVGSIRFGTWGYCTTLNGTDSIGCFKHSHGYSVKLGSNPAQSNTEAQAFVTIGSSWTRGLAVHVVAFVAALAGLVLTAIPKQTIRLAAMAVNAIAALLALIAFAIDIALLAYVQTQLKKISSPKTMPGPAFYMALIAIPVAVLATVLNWLNWRSEKLDNVVTNGYEWEEANDGAKRGWGERFRMKKRGASAEPGSQQKVLDAYEESKAT
ncbi:Actin cortical patch SUR7/pH-response regulator PalI [Kalmanozyma brasiliensis GHG001]|uniref:Pali-domain-containing protein n=1 Tax=Kalmanozyma brasiliensis (strain GHG001) TaxID=1365824 RepID=V5EVH8_KALBG|nr:Actin cortical patch SUR7/pH-response regulator PalI [Kalmanozyma brasiliensis GHG001]EST09490.1 Actin cortical patch SUR7/pH-response regulator PalI [Kalmanozyma brasiliensis GHG001]